MTEEEACRQLGHSTSLLAAVLDFYHRQIGGRRPCEPVCPMKPGESAGTMTGLVLAAMMPRLCI